MKRFVALLFVALALPGAAAPTLFSLEDVLSAPFGQVLPESTSSTSSPRSLPLHLGRLSALGVNEGVLGRISVMSASVAYRYWWKAWSRSPLVVK